MGSLTIRVGLVDTTGMVGAETMVAVAGALNVQVTRDLPQYWDIKATVGFLADKDKIPQGVWPVQIVKELPAGEGGFHLTKHNQPFAKVIFTPDSSDWTVDASHETLEMLVDSAGNRLQSSEAIRPEKAGVVDDPSGKFEYLVEVCDPCEADDFTYQIDGYAVSDFITPHFYDLNETPGTRYSFTGAIKRPREVLKGGYISFVNLEKDVMQQILWLDAQGPQLRTLGPASGSSLRAFVENSTASLTRDQRARGRKPEGRLQRLADYRETLAKAANVRAHYYYSKEAR